MADSIKYDPNRFEDMANDNALVNSDAAKVAGANALNTFLFGYGPQIYGAAKHPVDAAKGILSPGDQTDQNNGYLADRDAALRYLQESSKKYPNATILGKGQGLAATALIPGELMEAAPTALGRIGQGAAVGATYGAIQNPGDTAGKIDPAQLPSRSVNAGVGGMVGGLLTGVGELAGKVGEHLSKMTPAQAEAYRNNPGAVKAIAGRTDLENSEGARSALKSSSDSIKGLVFEPGGINDQVVGHLDQVDVPTDKLDALKAFFNGKTDAPSASLNLSNDKISGNDLRDLVQSAGDQRYVKDPITGAVVGKNDLASAAYGEGRQAIGAASPEAAQGIDALAESIKAQQGLKPGNTKPVGFLINGKPDASAARQAADEISGQDLSDVANQYSAAYQMNSRKGHGIRPAAGRAMITASKSAAPISSFASRALAPEGGFVDVSPNPAPPAPVKFDPNRFEVVGQ